MEGTLSEIGTPVALFGYGPYFANLEPGDFRAEIEGRWKAVDHLRETLVSQVEDGLLSPLDGWNAIQQVASCVAPAILGRGIGNGGAMPGFDIAQLSDLTQVLTGQAGGKH